MKKILTKLMLLKDLLKIQRGVYDDAQNVIGLIDEAWDEILKNNLKGIEQPGGRTVFVYDSKRRIGWEGGTLGVGQQVDAKKLQLILRTGTTEVVSAFPIL